MNFLHVYVHKSNQLVCLKTGNKKDFFLKIKYAFIFQVHKALKNEEVPAGFKVKDLVDQVLNDSGFGQKRARTMDIDDFMKLLHAFNSVGLHFA